MSADAPDSNHTPNALRLALRAGFVVYALALATATHWPGVVIHGPVPRPDLWVHLGAYATWTALLLFTRWLGAVSVRSAVLAMACAIVYGGLDELTQPIFNRTADWSDWGADALGAAVGACAGLAAAKTLARLFPPAG